MYDATTDKDRLQDSRKLLDWIYGLIPDTKGCMENNTKVGGCGSWCCATQNPQVMYVEFQNTWHHVKHNWDRDNFFALVERCLRAYLFTSDRKGCVFWDKTSKLCRQHGSRPFNCRIYGITPEEEFKPRYERLKVLYPDTRNQCNLVSTVDGSPVVKQDIDKWWSFVRNAEQSLGIKPKLINDQFGGSYRTYYEHILLETLGEEGMEMLSKARVAGSETEKLGIIDKAMEGLRSLLDVKYQSQSNNG